MMYTLEQFVKHVGGTRDTIPDYGVIRKSASAVQLADDTKLSVQAGEYLYSTPRKDFAEFTHVEVGFPTFDPPKEWMEYAEEADSPQDTVYGYIPIQMVLDYVNSVGIK